MNRIEKVFQIPKAGNLYENIKISVEGEDTVEMLSDIYITLYMDRVVSALLNATGDMDKYVSMVRRVEDVKEELSMVMEG